MPEMLDFARMQDAYLRGVQDDERKHLPPSSQTTALDMGKDIHLRVAKLSSAAVFQHNWPRIILREVNTANRLSSHAYKLELVGGVEPAPVKPAAVNPDQVVAYITSGGRKAVVGILRALRNKPVHGDADRVITEVLTEVMQANISSHPNSADVEKTRRESFIQRAQRLDEQGRTDAALDLIYDSIDEMMRIGQFVELDCLLEHLPTSTLSVDMLLGVLTATLPARSRLSNRREFFREAEASLKDRGEFEDGLLTGLG